EKRQVVRFAFYKLDSAWRRLSAERQASSKIEFGEIIESFAGRLLLRPYGLVGIRGDCDFLLWQVAENLDALVALQTALNRTDLGAYLTSPYSYLAMTRRSIYEFPEDPRSEEHTSELQSPCNLVCRLLLERSVSPQHLHSFPTRRSSDLYGLVGIRGDCDFLLWQVAENLDALVALQTALNRTDLGAYLTSPYSYLAMTRRSIYEFPEDP